MPATVPAPGHDDHHGGDKDNNGPVPDGEVHIYHGVICDIHYFDNDDNYDHEYDDTDGDSDDDDVDDDTFQEHFQTWLGGGFLVFPGRRRRQSQSAWLATLRCRGGWRRRKK